MSFIKQRHGAVSEPGLSNESCLALRNRSQVLKSIAGKRRNWDVAESGHRQRRNLPI